jgi:hypothetical protein
LRALDVRVAEVDAGAAFGYNRSLGFGPQAGALAALEIGPVAKNKRPLANIRAGLLAGGKGESVLTSAAAGLAFNLADTPISLGCRYVYNGLPAYETQIHALSPAIFYEGQRFGASWGISRRALIFAGERAIIETMISTAVTVTLLRTETLVVRLRAGNYDEFSVGNFGAYQLSLGAEYAASPKLKVRASLELLQSGSVALLTTFYGAVLHGGVIITL